MKIALVTGASSGIGADAARHLAANGYRVLLVARRPKALQAVVDRLGPDAAAEACDAADGDAVLALAERVRRHHGVPDVVVNCAGAGQWKRIEDTTPAEALEMIKAPYLAAFNMTHAFMNDMLTRRSGVFIHVNSPACIATWPASVGYSAARCALRGLHASIAQDLAGTGVKSCNLILGRVDSPYFDNNPGAAENMPGMARLMRTLTTDECGRLIARLAEHPRYEVAYPFMLRLNAWLHRLAPGFVNWLLRISGAKRHQSAGSA